MNGKERPWHRSLHGKVAAEKCVQIGYAAGLDLDRGRKNDPVGPFIRLEKIGSRVALVRPAIAITPKAAANDVKTALTSFWKKERGAAL